MARADHVVLDEPFSRSYYYGPDRRSSRYAERAARQLCRGGALPDRGGGPRAAGLRQGHGLSGGGRARARPAEQVRELLPGARSAATLRSLARHWPDFSDEETGWARLDEAARIVDSLRATTRGPRRRPAVPGPTGCGGVVRADGPAVRRGALTWEPGMRDEWDLWSDWQCLDRARRGLSRAPRAAAATDPGRAAGCTTPARRRCPRLPRAGCRRHERTLLRERAPRGRPDDRVPTGCTGHAR